MNVHEQRMSALEKANEVRKNRTDLKTDLKDGTKKFNDVMEEMPDYIIKMKVMDCVMSIPRFHRRRARGILTSCRIAHSLTFEELTDRQHNELVERLKSY